MIINETHQTVQLMDGRTLGYVEWGAPQGTPVFAFHGSPGSRLDIFMAPLEEVSGLNARLIVPDRPGIGRSDFQPGRKLLDWPADVVELAGALGIERFAVLGVSGGGPYAAACAYQIPECLTRAAIVSGVAPLNVPGITRQMGQSRLFFTLARLSPSLAGWMMRSLKSGLERDPGRIIAQVTNTLPDPDREILAQPQVQQAFMRTLREALRNGTQGVSWDTAVIAREWGFRPEEISLPVKIFHGEADTNAPVAMGRYMANAIPNAQARFFPGEGHFSTFVKYLEEIVQALVD